MNSNHSTNRLIVASIFMLILLSAVINASFYSLRSLAQVQNTDIPQVLGDDTGQRASFFDHTNIDPKDASFSIAFDEDRVLYVKSQDKVLEIIHSSATIIPGDFSDRKWYGLLTNTQTTGDITVVDAYQEKTNKRLSFLVKDATTGYVVLYDPHYFIEGVRSMKVTLKSEAILAIHKTLPIILIEDTSDSPKRSITIVDLRKNIRTTLNNVRSIRFRDNTVRYTKEDNGTREFIEVL